MPGITERFLREVSGLPNRALDGLVKVIVRPERFAPRVYGPAGGEAKRKLLDRQESLLAGRFEGGQYLEFIRSMVFLIGGRYENRVLGSNVICPTPGDHGYRFVEQIEGDLRVGIIQLVPVWLGNPELRKEFFGSEKQPEFIEELVYGETLQHPMTPSGIGTMDEPFARYLPLIPEKFSQPTHVSSATGNRVRPLERVAELTYPLSLSRLRQVCNKALTVAF